MHWKFQVSACLSVCVCLHVWAFLWCMCFFVSVVIHLWLCACVFLYIKGVCVFCFSVDVRRSCQLSSLLLRLVFALPVGGKRRTGCLASSRDRCIDSNTDKGRREVWWTLRLVIPGGPLGAHPKHKQRQVDRHKQNTYRYRQRHKRVFTTTILIWKPWRIFLKSCCG